MNQITKITLIIVLLTVLSTASSQIWPPSVVLMSVPLNKTPAYGCAKVIMRTKCVKLLPGCSKVDTNTNVCIKFQPGCSNENGKIVCQNTLFHI